MGMEVQNKLPVTNQAIACLTCAFVFGCWMTVSLCLFHPSLWWNAFNAKSPGSFSRLVIASSQLKCLRGRSDSMTISAAIMEPKPSLLDGVPDKIEETRIGFCLVKFAFQITGFFFFFNLCMSPILHAHVAQGEFKGHRDSFESEVHILLSVPCFHLLNQAILFLDHRSHSSCCNDYF